MARGWESKAVESQMESAAEQVRPRASEWNAAAVLRQRERESLELSRTRVLQDIAQAANPKYKEILTRSLLFLDEKLAELERGEAVKRRRSTSNL